MTGDELLGLVDAARIARVTPGALRRAARIGTLDAIRIGERSYAVTRDALAAYLVYVSQRSWLNDPAKRPGPRPRAGGPKKRRRRRRRT